MEGSGYNIPGSTQKEMESNINIRYNHTVPQSVPINKPIWWNIIAPHSVK